MGKIKNPSEKRKIKQFSNVCIKVLRLTALTPGLWGLFFPVQ
jgi:hypothetical protein